MQMLFPTTLSISEHGLSLYRTTVVLKGSLVLQKAKPAESRMMSKATALNSGSAKRLSKKATTSNSQVATADFTVLTANYVVQALFPKFFSNRKFYFQGTCCTCAVFPWQQHCPRQKLTVHLPLQTLNALYCNCIQMKQCTKKGLQNCLLPFFMLLKSHTECFCSTLATLQIQNPWS